MDDNREKIRFRCSKIPIFEQQRDALIFHYRVYLTIENLSKEYVQQKYTRNFSHGLNTFNLNLLIVYLHIIICCC